LDRIKEDRLLPVAQLLMAWLVFHLNNVVLEGQFSISFK
jgi:hypothetical protein